MFARLKQRVRWSALQVSFLQKEYDQFLRDLAIYEESYDLRAFQVAMKGVSQLITGNYESAYESFEKARIAGERVGNPDGEYISRYCRARLAALAGQEDVSVDLEASMILIRCSPVLLRVLPYR